MTAQANTPSRWKRVGYSFASAFFAEVLTGVGVSWRYGTGNRLGSIAVFVLFASYLVLPGWILSLPLVLLIENADGWRFWLIAIIGASIGPLVVAGIAAYAVVSSPTHTTWNYSAISFLYYAIAISLLTTAFYLTFLKLSTRIQQPTP